MESEEIQIKEGIKSWGRKVIKRNDKNKNGKKEKMRRMAQIRKNNDYNWFRKIYFFLNVK